MVWLIFALGGCLCAAGAAAIGLGVDFIDIERGWTQVISGTVAVSGGIVTLALACILLRLGAVQRSLAANALANQSLANAVAEFRPTPDAAVAPTTDTAPTTESTERTMAPYAEPVQSLVPQEIQEDLTQHPADPDTSGAVRSLEPAVASRVETPVAPPPAYPVASDVSPIRSSIKMRVPEPSPAHDAGHTPPPLQERPPRTDDTPDQRSEVGYSVDWLEDALNKLEEETDWAIPVRNEPKSSRDTSNGSGHEPEDVAEPNSESTAAGDTGPAIVGRYSAGGVSYSMFVDGSIEADTAGGVFKFQSIEELKAFIGEGGAATRPA